jgi:hypothetical protein
VIVVRRNDSIADRDKELPYLPSFGWLVWMVYDAMKSSDQTGLVLHHKD